MKPNPTMLAVLSALAAGQVFAADTEAGSSLQNPLTQHLEEIVVKSEPFAQKMGTQRITNPPRGERF